MNLTKHTQKKLGVPSQFSDIIKGLGLEGVSISELDMVGDRIETRSLLRTVLKEAARVSDAVSIVDAPGGELVTNKTLPKYIYDTSEAGDLHAVIPLNVPDLEGRICYTDVKDTETGKEMECGVMLYNALITYKVSEKGIYNINASDSLGDEEITWSTNIDIEYQEVEGIPIHKETLTEDGVETVYTYEAMKKFKNSRNLYQIPIYKNGSFFSYIEFKLEKDKNMRLTKHALEDLGVPSPYFDIIKGLGLEGANISELSTPNGSIGEPLLLTIVMMEAIDISDVLFIEYIKHKKIVTNKTYANYTYIYSESNNLHVRVPDEPYEDDEVISCTDIIDTARGKEIHYGAKMSPNKVIYSVSEEGIVYRVATHSNGEVKAVNDIEYQEVEGIPIRKETVTENGVTNVYTYDALKKVKDSKNRYRLNIYKNGDYYKPLEFKVERD